ncbi:hypothetical protein HZA56_09680 [Candidatus Poribacteria bacterium]|nr:hypothetical protein [Candidatus Poribacteria bacterium]
MAHRILIEAGNVKAEAELNLSKTAELVWNALPVESIANTWGDEIYFDLPIRTGIENGVEIVEVGDLGYWPQGPSFCIFFGPTPVSKGNEIRPASAVNLIGRVLGDAKLFKKVSDGQKVKISPL